MKICIVEAESSEHQFFEEELVDHELCFAEHLTDVDTKPEVLSVFIYSRIDAAFLDQHPQLRLITTRSTTLDQVDLEECARRNITVCNVGGYGDYTVAEHTFALVLAVARRLREAMAGRGGRFSYENTRGLQLRGKTFGVIGAGRVGRHVIRMAKAFEMNVIAHDIHEDAAAAQSLGFRYVSLDELLHTSDVISLHATLTSDSFHILDRKAFAKCKPGVLIVNTARGRLIDTESLIEALDSGVVAGAGLDVLGEEKVMRQKATKIITEQIAQRVRGEEPDESHPGNAKRVKQLKKLIHLEDLLSRPNVVFTPHIAFNTAEAVERIKQATVENIRAYIAGKPANVVRPPTAGSPTMKKLAVRQEHSERA